MNALTATSLPALSTAHPFFIYINMYTHIGRAPDFIYVYNTNIWRAHLDEW